MKPKESKHGTIIALSLASVTSIYGSSLDSVDSDLNARSELEGNNDSSDVGNASKILFSLKSYDVKAIRHSPFKLLSPEEQAATRAYDKQKRGQFRRRAYSQI